jgi:hypothetical protein
VKGKRKRGKGGRSRKKRKRERGRGEEGREEEERRRGWGARGGREKERREEEGRRGRGEEEKRGGNRKREGGGRTFSNLHKVWTNQNHVLCKLRFYPEALEKINENRNYLKLTGKSLEAECLSPFPLLPFLPSLLLSLSFLLLPSPSASYPALPSLGSPLPLLPPPSPRSPSGLPVCRFEVQVSDAV